MSEKIVDARIEIIKGIQLGSNENLLNDYKTMLCNGAKDNWFVQQHEKEILERMR